MYPIRISLEPSFILSRILKVSNTPSVTNKVRNKETVNKCMAEK